MATHILIPRKLNLGQVSKIDVVLNWQLANKVETKWIGEVIYHMVEKRRKENMWLPIQSLDYENSGTFWI